MSCIAKNKGKKLRNIQKKIKDTIVLCFNLQTQMEEIVWKKSHNYNIREN